MMRKFCLLLCFFLCLGVFPTPSVVAQENPTKVYNIRGNLPDLDFELQGHQGNVSAQDLRGKINLVFFGYASCPDICPTTMAELSLLKQSLGDLGQHIQIVFISVDPYRDTPDRLQQYVDAFNAQAIGLTGTEKQIARIAKRYRVAYQIEKPAEGMPEHQYEVMHAQGIYIFDAQGKAQWLASNAQDTELLKEKLLSLGK